MTENNETWLREGLADAVPTPPASPDRADRALRQARRSRRTATAAVGGAAAAVLAIAGVLAIVGNGAPADRPDRGRDIVADSPTDAPACPDEPLDAQGQRAEVPSGATAVRLCTGVGNPIEVPGDALVTGVGDLIDTINALEVLPDNVACTQELGPGFQLVFDYPGGSPVAVNGEVYGCQKVTIGDTTRTSARDVWGRFSELLAAQRKNLTPPADAVPATPNLDCTTLPAGPSVGRGEDLVAAVYCVELRNGDLVSTDLSADDLSALTADIAAHTKKNAGYVDCDVTPPVPAIIGITAWGDRVGLHAQCTNGWFTVDEPTNSVWNPSSKARVILQRLFREAR